MFAIPTEESINEQPFINLPQHKLYELVSTFVVMQCPSDPDDDSHGWIHMQIVANLSYKFAQELGLSTMYLRLAIVVGWLHDVADHKLKEPLRTHRSEALNGFLRSLTSDRDHAEWLRQIIDWVSFSKENTMRKNGDPMVEETGEPAIWRKTLGDIGTDVRNIVSDADKSQAIFEIGLWRCYIHTKMNNPDIGNKEIVGIMKQHGEDKLFRLVRDKFIRTPPGVTHCQKGAETAQKGIEQLESMVDNQEEFDKLLHKFRSSTT